MNRRQPSDGLASCGRFRLFGALAVILYAVVLSPAVIHGFKRKRALFLGGEIPDWEEVWPFPLVWAKRGPSRWEGFPRDNIYRLEDELFRSLGVRKRHEVALDVYMAPAPYFTFWSFSLLCCP
jgi:hypothetical protein